MKSKARFRNFSELPVAALVMLAGCSQPSGPATAADLQAITNLVQRTTTDPIQRVEQLDSAIGRMLVVTGTNSAKERSFVLDRGRWGWKIRETGVK